MPSSARRRPASVSVDGRAVQGRLDRGKDLRGLRCIRRRGPRRRQRREPGGMALYVAGSRGSSRRLFSAAGSFRVMTASILSYVPRILRLDLVPDRLRCSRTPAVPWRSSSRPCPAFCIPAGMYFGSWTASTVARMVPNTATPIVAPIWRKNWLLLVAAPISCGFTEFCTARV